MSDKTPIGWKNYKINDLGFIGRGKSRHRPRNEPSLYGGIYPFFQTGDIKEADLYLHRYTQTYNEKGLAQSKLWKPGTLCITIAANIAETAILNVEGCFPDSVVGFIPNNEKSDVRFVKYYIDTIKNKMQNVSRGTTQDNLSIEKILTFNFLTPPLPTQQKIATILSTYDDLIENNNRRIRILEEMAQMIYREWFVNFRFPGHEGMRMVESELGPVPEGWEVSSLNDEIEPIRGLSYKGAGLSDSGMPLHNLNSVLEGGGYKFSGIKYYTGVFQEKHKILPGDIIVTNTEQGFEYRLIGFPAIVPRCFGENGIFSHHIYRIRPRPNSYLRRSFVYYLLMTDMVRRQIISYANGTTVNMLSIEGLQNPKFIRPPKKIIFLFDEFAQPICDLIESYTEKNANLRRTRALLLPKLIRGELDVSGLDIEIPEAEV